MELRYPLLRCVDPPFPNGLLHSPFVIAIRNRALADRQLLDWLGCSDYQPREPGHPEIRRPRVYISEDPEWTLIADDWTYSLFHRCGDHRLSRGARWGEMFTFWMGDADNGYGFSHYVEGSRQRAYVVDATPSTDRVIVLDEGPPLPAESSALRAKDAAVIVWALAESLGIEADHRNKEFRCYGAPPPPDGAGRL